jgi:hypothetical protein
MIPKFFFVAILTFLFALVIFFFPDKTAKELKTEAKDSSSDPVDDQNKFNNPGNTL